MKMNKNKKQNIVIYRDSHGNVEVKADVEKETIWATQEQIAKLFDTQRPAITKHLNNIFNSRELDKNSVCSILERTAKDGKVYNIKFYNLDAIIAVGYRVSSKKATEFRIWATSILRDYIVKGVAVNNDRIRKIPVELITDLDQKIKFIQRTVRSRELLERNEIDGVLSVINGYNRSWRLLLDYDEGSLKIKIGKTKERQRFEYDYIWPAILELKETLMKKGEASDLFGHERDPSFKGILRTIYQTFDKKELYDSLEEKAAHLLYFIIKDHPFSDGNKRIGAFMFIYFLDRNEILYRTDSDSSGEKKISDNMLVALALLIAESDPKEKETMVALTTHLIA